MLRLWIEQSGLGLPDPDYYQDAEVKKVYKEVVRSALSDVYKQSKASVAGHAKSPAPDASKVYDFEASLAKLFVDR